MSYRVLRRDPLELGSYQVTAYRHEDLIPIMQWRNAQMAVLRQNVVLTEEVQQNYFENQIKPTFDAQTPRQILFSFLHDGKLIGYGGLTNTDWIARRAEVSFLVNPGRTHDTTIYESDFSHFLALMKRAAFDELGLNRLFTETYDVRPHHISILESNGFRLEGRLRSHALVDGRLVDSLIHGCLKENDHV